MTDEEKKPYHTIMTSAWRLFTKERKPEKFTDEWWKEIISDYDRLRDPYKGTPMDAYVCQINQCFLDEWERLQKHDRPQRVSTPVLSEPQGYHQEELQLTNAVFEVGGNKEVDEPLSASDWG